MGIHSEIARRKVVLATLDGTTDAGPTIGVIAGAAGTIVCVLVDDPIATTTSIVVTAGQWLPISIKKWVSGPADSVGFA